VALSVGLSLGNGTFTEPGGEFPPVNRGRSWRLRRTAFPTWCLAGDGKILFRAGLAAGGFGAPLVINPELAWPRATSPSAAALD